MKRIIVAFALLFALIIKAQNTEKLLVGKWVYVKTVDNTDKEVDGEATKMGKEIVIKDDKTFKNDFEDGNWNLVSDDEIEFECIVPENSVRGKAIVLDQKMGGKKRRTDGRGNFLDTSLTRIVSITPELVKIIYDEEYYQVYKKIN